MADEVKKDAQTASTEQEVKKDDTEASTVKETSVDADLVQALADSLDREEKLKIERDNYKKGMLKAKGKDADAHEDDAAASADTKGDSAELIGVVKQLLKRNQELETAVITKAQVSTSGQGAGSDSKVEVGDNMLSAEQLKDLKGRGWDDAKIARFKANLLKT